MRVICRSYGLDSTETKIDEAKQETRERQRTVAAKAKIFFSAKGRRLTKIITNTISVSSARTNALC